VHHTQGYGTPWYMYVPSEFVHRAKPKSELGRKTDRTGEAETKDPADAGLAEAGFFLDTSGTFLQTALSAMGAWPPVWSFPMVERVAAALQPRRRKPRESSEPHPNPEELLSGKNRISYPAAMKVLGVKKRRLQQLISDERRLKRVGTPRKPMITVESIRIYLRGEDIAQ